MFICTACSYRANADHNVAKSILAVGHTVLAWGEKALALSKKAEITGNGQPSTSLITLGITDQSEGENVNLSNYLYCVE